MADTILTGMEVAYSDRFICVCAGTRVFVSLRARVKVTNMAPVMTDPAEGYSEPQSVSLCHRRGGGWTTFLITQFSIHKPYIIIRRTNDDKV